jgi:hypothetical protein
VNIEQTVRHARLYARAKGLIAEIRLISNLRKLFLGIFAVGMAVFGFTLINLGLYHALAALWGDVWTPLAIGAADLVIAAVALMIAARMTYGPELKIAEELRDAVAADIEADLRSLQGLPGLAGLLSNSFEANAARLLVPAMGLIIRALRNRKTAV